MAANLSYDLNGKIRMALLASEGNAWHGEGNMLPDNATFDEWLEAAGFAHLVQIPLVFDANQIVNRGESPELVDSGAFGIIDTLVNACVGVVTSQYKIHQPKEILESLWRVTNNSEAFHMTSAGMLKNGTNIFAQMTHKESFNVLGSDKHYVGVLASSSTNGTMSTRSDTAIMRTVCSNTQSINLSTSRVKVKFSHKGEFTEENQEQMIREFAKACATIPAYQALAEDLAYSRFTLNRVDDAFRAMLGIQEGDESNPKAIRLFGNLDRLHDSLKATMRESGDRYREVTGYDLYNTVTRYFDHDATTRRVDGIGEIESRFVSAQYGNGKKGKSDFIAELKQICGIDDSKYQDIFTASYTNDLSRNSQGQLLLA